MRSHEARLKKLYENKTGFDLDKPVEVKLSAFEVSTKIDEKSSIYEVFNYAIEAEQKAHDLYAKLADLDFDITIKSFFGSLASDEAKHRINLQNEYQKEFGKEYTTIDSLHWLLK